MSDSENIQTIKEVKKYNKGKKKMNLTEDERKRRSENMKKNALGERKKIIDDKKQLDEYKKNLGLLLGSSDSEADDEELYKQVAKQSKKSHKTKNYESSSDEEITNPNYQLNEYAKLIKTMEAQNKDFNDQLKNIYAIQEKSNNRIERLYQAKKQKFKQMKSEPIIINNDKNTKLKENVQDAIMNKILNQ